MDAHDHTSKGKLYLDGGIIALLAFATAFLYGAVLDNYWLFDDPQILKHASDYHPWEYFFVPRIWRELSLVNLTPLLTLSFDIDHALFDFGPKGFYFHQLVSLWLVSVTLYLFLNLWLSRSFSFFGSLLFLVSAPAGVAAELLMLRHYVEGSLSAIASFYLFTVSLRRKSIGLACLSAALYLVAMSAKEIYVPLVFVTLFLPEGDWRSRVRHALPSLFCFFLYFLWRFHMLGTFVGGYRNTLAPENSNSDFVTVILGNVSESIKMLSGGSPGGVAVHKLVLLTVLMATLFILFTILRDKKNYPRLIFLSASAFAVYLPLFPLFNAFDVNNFLSYRLVYFVSVATTSLIAFFASYLAALEIPKNLRVAQEKNYSGINLSGPRLFSYLIFLSVLFSVLLSARMWLHQQREIFLKPLVKEGRFLEEADDSGVLMVKMFPMPANSYYENLDYFVMRYKKHRLPDAVYDIFAHVDGWPKTGAGGSRVYKFAPRAGAVVDYTEEFMTKRDKYLSRVRKLPLNVVIEVKDEGLSFSLGPSSAGRYFVLAGYRPGLYCASIDVKREMSVRLRLYSGLRSYLRFGWESPEGWITLTPEWFVDFSRNQQILWSQESALEKNGD